MPDENVEAAAAESAKPEKAVARAGGGMVAAGQGGHAVVVAPAPVTGPGMPAVSRRKVLLIGFWTAMGAMLASIAVTILNSIYPRHVARLTGVHATGWTVSTLQPGDKQPLLIQVPDPNAPLLPLSTQIYLVRLNAEQAAHNPGTQAGEIYAFWRKCPHLGCTVPWSPTFSFDDPRSGQTYSGWFRCPCHGSTYSDAGVKVFGPAPRSLDKYPLVIADDGSISVNVGTVITGSAPLSPDEVAGSVLPS
jgi:Rieske Fe-S protein